jgi:hypothetical protein
MPSDSEKWRTRLRRSVANEVEHHRLENWDPFGLGAMRIALRRLFVLSRELNEVQSMALAEELRDYADRMESRWH